jgi:hypothetical protein
MKAARTSVILRFLASDAHTVGKSAMAVSRREVLGGALALGSLRSIPALAASNTLTEIASSSRSWVQVAVAPSGRIFVNHSRWFGPLEMAVAEIDVPDGNLRAYPDAAFSGGDEDLPASRRAVSVQSVLMDPGGESLWIVDSGNPQLSGPVRGGAKLIEVDLRTDAIRRSIMLGPDAAPPGSYLADLRIDARHNRGYLPDLALGALVVVDLASGRGRRILEGHPSTRAEDLVLEFDGKPWLYPDGSRPKTACTSIALSSDGATLYFKALVGRTLYALPTAALDGAPEDIAAAVRVAVVAHPTDAITFGPDGALYMTAIDRSAITRWRPGTERIETVVSDPRLAWPVGLTFDAAGRGFTTVGRIHEGGAPTDRYRLFSFDPV